MFLTRRTFTKLSTKSSFSTSLKTNSFLKFLKSEILSEPKEVQQPLLRGWTIKDIKGEKEFSLKNNTNLKESMKKSLLFLVPIV